MTEGERAEGDRCDAWEPSDCTGSDLCPPRCPRYVADDGTAVTVRPYEDGDFDGVVDLYDGVDARRRTMGVPPVGHDRVVAWVERVTTGSWGLVAVADGRVVGHAAVAPDDDPAPEFVVFVREEYHGRGVGTEMVKHLVAYAADRGHEALELDVSKGNDSAVRVYRNVAFEEVAETTTKYRVRLSTDHPVADVVRLPPAERPDEGENDAAGS